MTDTVLKNNLPKWIEEIMNQTLQGGLIHFTKNYFDIYEHSESGFNIRLIPVNNQILSVNIEDWEKLTDFSIYMFDSTIYNAYAVHLHQQFLKSLVDYIFGYKQLHEKYFYFDSRSLYDTTHKMYIIEGVQKDLVQYLKDGYKLCGKRFLRKKGCSDIRIVLDHFNLPEAYYKKLLIFCIKNKVWPTFDYFVKNVVYPLSKVRIVLKTTHDGVLGKSTDFNRGTLYEDKEVLVCEYKSPYKEISNKNIWTICEQQKKKYCSSLVEILFGV